MLITDAHLDLAYTALRGRDVTLPASQQTPNDNDGAPSVGLPDLRAGHVDLICATIFCEPAKSPDAAKTGYKTAEEARAAALAQLNWYQSQERAGRLHIVRTKDDLPAANAAPPTTKAIILMEGADPLRSPDDVPEWHAAGLRVVGLAWKATRLAGGTGEPGPLTAEGRALVPALDRAGIIHDTSHLAEQSFWELLDLTPGPVFASHSKFRSIVPTDRQLSDDMIKALVKRGGVIGINFFEKFLLRPAEYKTRPATLADLVAHVKHIADLTGSAQHIGLGSDMDGGFGAQHIPHELKTSADLPKIADALHSADFADEDVKGILGLNFLRFFQINLPA
jgi:membrane dipeptidase